MARPTRARRPPLRFLNDGDVIETSNKIAEINDDDKETATEAAAPKSRRAKGADDKSAKKTAKATRQTAKLAAIDEVQAEVPDRAKKPLRQTRAKNLPSEKENSEKENSENASPAKPVAKKKSTSTKVTDEATDARTKETATRTKAAKVTTASGDHENSLVIESENIADVDVTPKKTTRSVRSGPKRIGKRVVSSRLSTSRRSKSSVNDRSFSKKSVDRSPEASEKVGGDATTKSEVGAAKKFFKSRAPGAAANMSKILPGKRTATTKRRKIVEKPKPRVSTSFRLRQTTLSESFAKQALKRALRPRTAPRNYRDASVLEKTATSDEIAPKGPVYRTAKLSDKSDDNDDEIYEFHFDRNDSREKIPKKRKRKAPVAPRKTRPRAAGPKKTTTSKRKAAAKSATEPDEVTETRTKVPAAIDEPMETNDVPAITVNDFDSPPVVATSPTRLKHDDPRAERAELPKSGPKVVESVELTGEKRIELTSTPQLTKLTETTRPQQPRATTGRPTVQYKTMLKHVLLNRSLSPIKKALESFDPGSPWRPPVIAGPQFSRVKNVVQSTPHVRKFSAMLENKRDSADTSAESVRPIKMNRIAEKDENNENAKQTSQKSPVKVPSAAKSPRKFGTVISNVNVSIAGASPTIGGNSAANASPTIGGNSAANASPMIGGNSAAKTSPTIGGNSAANALHESPRKIDSVASPSKRLVDSSIPAISDVDNDAAENFAENFNDHADKENSVPAPASPRKMSRSPKKFATLRSPLRPFNRAKTTTTPKENREPQPGPSGLQKRSPLGDSRILKQSNLNNFLNIDQLPTSSRIAHGIFADAHSTPIAGKPVRTTTKEPTVENAFGFDDIGDSDVELSPIKNSLFADPPAPIAAKKIVAKRPKIVEEKNIAIAPTRFSVGEIKKHLRPVAANEIDEDDPVKRIEAAERENREGKKGKAVTENEKIEDKAAFSDTFDVQTEAQENTEENVVEEIPLFADLEPVHFKQPPRHSYKRKRIVAFNFSEDEEDDAESSPTGEKNRGTKKRKVSKVEKQRQKKLEEWAKNLNNTFEEIDHFDLVVE